VFLLKVAKALELTELQIGAVEGVVVTGALHARSDPTMQIT
jgi:hypothetical protein